MGTDVPGRVPDSVSVPVAVPVAVPTVCAPMIAFFFLSCVLLLVVVAVGNGDSCISAAVDVGCVMCVVAGCAVCGVWP